MIEVVRAQEESFDKSHWRVSSQHFAYKFINFNNNMCKSHASKISASKINNLAEKVFLWITKDGLYEKDVRFRFGSLNLSFDFLKENSSLEDPKKLSYASLVSNAEKLFSFIGDL